MAAGTWKWHGPALLAAFNKEIDVNSDSWKMLTAGVSYTPNQDTHDYANDVTDLITGTGVPSGGIALSGGVTAYTAGTNVFKIDFDDVNQNPATATGIKNLIIIDATPSTDATRPILCSCVLDSLLSPNAAPLTVTFDATGGAVGLTIDA